eukprot:264381_1
MAKTILSSAFIQLFSDHLWFNRIVILLATIVAAFILIFHGVILSYQCYLKKVEKQIANLQLQDVPSQSSQSQSTDTSISSNKLSIMNHVLVISTLLFTLLHNTWDLLGIFGSWYTWFGKLSDCGLFTNVAVIWWHCAKYSMYYIFLLRLKIAFDGSAYEYKKILYGLTIFL